jgi:uncharacterized membrane protein HdeD (DUF308 family)
MSQDPGEQIDKLQQQIATAAHDHWKFLLAQGIVMIVLGLLAVVLPNVATLAVEILIGSLFLAGGLIRLFTLPRCRTAPGFWWSVVMAALAVLLGIVLLVKPAQGVLTLTMVLVAFFIAEGILAIAAAFMAHRPAGAWGWMLLSGVVDLVLAYLIWRGWPASAAWAIGLLVGINMFFLGLSVAMTALAARTMSDG